MPTSFLTPTSGRLAFNRCNSASPDEVRRTRLGQDDAPNVMMSWLLLIIAGLLETCWAVGLKYTEGFTRPMPSIFVGLSAACSLVLLAIAVRTIPVGTAYAIWVGIGALGAALLGIVLFAEPITMARSLCLLLLLAALVGLKLTTH